MNYRSKFIVEPGEQASIFENQTFAMICFRWTEKPIKEFLKTTIIGGTSFLLPVALVVLVLSYALRLVKRIATPISHSLQLDQLGNVAGVGAATLLSVLALILVSFAAGIVACGRRELFFSGTVGDLPTVQNKPDISEAQRQLQHAKEQDCFPVRLGTDRSGSMQGPQTRGRPGTCICARIGLLDQR
jgi:hypothetical protein